MEETTERTLGYSFEDILEEIGRRDWNPLLVDVKHTPTREAVAELRKIAMEHGKDLVIYVPNYVVKAKRGFDVDELLDYHTELFCSMPFRTIEYADGAVAIGKTTIKIIKSRKEWIFDDDLKFKVGNLMRFEDV